MLQLFRSVAQQFPVLKQSILASHSAYILRRKVACWSCGHETANSVQCKKCNVLQEVDSKKNYFDILGIETSFDVNSPEVVKKYHKLQILFHPDKNVNRSEKEKAISETYSTVINKAYQTITDPLKRGIYMLQIKGINLNEEGISSNKSLLMDILAINEEISLAGNKQNSMKVKVKVQNKINQLLLEVSNAFKNNDLAAAHGSLMQLKYYNSAMQRLLLMKEKYGI